MHRTPRYVWNRLKLAWWQRRHPDAPWLTPDAVAILGSWLRPTDRGIEWGAGRSTLWFGARVQSLISVEPDFNWWTKIKQSAPPSVDLRYCGDLLEYVGFIDACEDESLDFALVDGKRRDECILAAIPKLKPGALLVLDNANWFFPFRKTYSPPSPAKQEGRWEEVFRAVKDWRCVWTSCGVTDTALFFKPAAPPT